MPVAAYAKTDSTYIKYYFDGTGNVIGARLLDCANGDEFGGVTSEYVLVTSGTCTVFGAPKGPFVTSAILPDGMTLAQACAYLDQEGGSPCNEAPFFNYPL
jgi:hypothetical protein